MALPPFLCMHMSADNCGFSKFSCYLCLILMRLLLANLLLRALPCLKFYYLGSTAWNLPFTCVVQGGLATAFDLAAFRLSMIAPVKKSVNHSRTVASMRGPGWEQQQHQEVRLRSDSTAWSEFAFGPVGHCFLCFNRFFPRWCGAYVLLSSGLAFLITCGLLRYKRDQWTVTVPRCPIFWRASPL